MDSFCQEWQPQNGAVVTENHYTLFTNATIFLADGTYLESAKLLIYKDKIVDLGKEISIPANTVKYDLKGKFIYPSLIELSSDFGIQKTSESNRSSSPQLNSNKKGPYYWNECIQPEFSAISAFKFDDKEAQEWRKKGVGLILSQRKDGLLRGTSTLLALSSNSKKQIINPSAGFHFSFNKGSSKQTYPSSLMGMMALIRQSLYDAKWYASNGGSLPYNASLAAINQYKNLPSFFEVESDLSVLRAANISNEFNWPFIIQGSGEEYKRIAEIKSTGASLLIPLDFPKAYDVSDPFSARQIPLAKLKEWELAPYNPLFLSKAEIEFAITSHENKDAKSFFADMEKAIEKGWSRSKAILSMTVLPAKMLNIDGQYGSLEKGKAANFLICSDSLFLKGNLIYENWVSGEAFILEEKDQIAIQGEYSLVVDKKEHYEVKIEGEKNKPSLKVRTKGQEKYLKGKVNTEGNRIQIQFENEEGALYRLTGTVSDEQSRICSGKTKINELWVDWGMIRKETEIKEKEKDNSKDSVSVKETEPAIFYPNAAYGWDSLPTSSETIIFRNATVWTNEKEGILKNYDVLVHRGKIHYIGYKLDINILFPSLAKNLVELDLKGKHLTSGIIDEHSHIALSRGVNESGQAISAEVSIGDVINSDDINIYRQLAGGVTAAQLLHGSANPIGGQSALIKLKWGLSPDSMKIKDAPGFIKFALGENVKQSNWGDRNTIRFPQTRMGVEQVFYDGFTRALAYKQDWELYNNKNKKQKKESIEPRVDLELQTLAEILDSNRFITCHSYIQSEINMLMHVADSMGFRVNTFTHILEGYKVADKMAAHGVAGSTFSDWWAYKFEVNDAIPYNGALMHQNGVLTGFNSDDAEMGRRLNQEAAKAIKYGGLSEEEAWKFVTLNPAKMLHLDDRMGSIKVGKDADLVVWTDNPLSIYAKVEQTYIDGILYFDWDRNLKLIQRNEIERERLIKLMLSAANKGEKTRPIPNKKKELYHCNTIGE